MKRLIPLECAAEKVCNESSKPPLIFQLPPKQARKVLEDAQNEPVYKCPAQIKVIEVDTGKWGKVKLYCVIPENIEGKANAIFYIHGGGWVLGSFHTHDKLIRELGMRTNSIIFFPEYTRSPEAKFPMALEQCYYIMCNLVEIAKKECLEIDFTTFTVAGDSVGGNMATALTIMAKYNKSIKITKQLLYYPVTNACFNTESYLKFAQNYYLYRDGMKWFWNQYIRCETDCNKIIASPLRASEDQLCGLPDAMIINGEADVLRDEGQAYAKKLLCAGVDVTAIQIQATIHDFVMLNALDCTSATRMAMDTSTMWINRKNYEQCN